MTVYFAPIQPMYGSNTATIAASHFTEYGRRGSLWVSQGRCSISSSLVRASGCFHTPASPLAPKVTDSQVVRKNHAFESWPTPCDGWLA